MRTSTKALVIGMTAAIAMALAVGTATAAHLSINTTPFDIKWNLPENPLRLIPPIGATVSCGVTLLGSFHSRTITKTANLLIGYVTHAEITPRCLGGSATIFSETLPWHLRYLSFTGTLPAITAVQTGLVGARFRIANEAATCNSITTARNPGRGLARVETLGLVTEVNAEGSIPLEGGFPCELGSGTFEGPGILENLAGGMVSITLI